MSDKPLPRTDRPPVIPSPRSAALGLYARRSLLLLPLALLVVAAGFSLAEPAFASRANLNTMLAEASVTGIAAMGLFIVMLTGGVDLSLGAVAALAPLVAGLAVGHLGTPELLLLALGAGSAIGLGTGLLVVGGGLAAFAVTLAVEVAVRGLASSLATGPERVGGFVDLLPGPTMMVLGVPASLALMAIIAGLIGTYLAAFRGGRILVAIGSSREAARAAGLETFWHGVLPYVLSGALAALAGLLSVAAIPSSLAVTEIGGTLTLDAFAAVLLGGGSLRGGRGSLLATLLGVLLVVAVRNGLSLAGAGSLWQGGAVGLLILAGLVADRVTRGRRDG